MLDSIIEVSELIEIINYPLEYFDSPSYEQLEQFSDYHEKCYSYGVI